VLRLMACRPGKVGRLQNLRRPARVFCGVVAVALLAASFFVSDSRSSLFVTAAGAVLLVVVFLLPAMTQFEVDVFGLTATASLSTREQKLEAICRRECRQIASFARLVGVESEQIDDLVEHAIEDTCRLWRGPVMEGLVGRFLVCRAAHLIQVSLRLGGPYRVLTPEGGGRYGAEWAAFAALDPRDRLIVALVEWVELDSSSVAAILDLDVGTVQQTLRRGVPTGLDGASA
jgi:hypothetical protein